MIDADASAIALQKSGSGHAVTMGHMADLLLRNVRVWLREPGGNAGGTSLDVDRSRAGRDVTA